LIRAGKKPLKREKSDAAEKGRKPAKAAEDADETNNGHAEEAVEETTEEGAAEEGDSGDPKSNGKRRKRATAQTMAAAQRDISVSEFFAKNRHLLGFDNPRKALLTAVKEAVDNSLDACEEAGILPELWVHIEQTGANRYKIGVQDNGPGIVKKQIPLIFGKLLYGSKFHRLRMSRGQQGIGISAAGMYGVLTTGKPVENYFEDFEEGPGALLRNSDQHEEQQAGNFERPRRGRRYSGRREGPGIYREARHRMGRRA